jgi:hypothetical protein
MRTPRLGAKARRCTSLGYAKSSELTRTDGAECALSMRFHSGGSGWITKSSFASVGLGWQNLSASHSGSSAAKQMPRRLHRRGS